ncbi:restriction endonuclease subunit S [Streptomyces uncialis]|uniref:restriction endonuclease subunit S n=1 Tax=Streptomyces uncialis TaxID=1048205 RepID=UPI00378FDB51
MTSSHYSNEGARVIRLGNIGAARFKDADAAYIPMEYFRELRQHEVNAGDLLIAGLGDTNNPVGRACVAPDLGPAIVKADCFRVRLDEGRLSHRFAAWALSSSFVSSQVKTLTRGSTRARINLDVAREVEVPLPSLLEQRRIADFLDAETSRIDRLLALQTTVLERLDERESAIVDLAIDELIDRVGTTPFRRFITAMDQGSSPQCDAVPASDDEWGVLKVSCLRPGSFFPDQNKRLPEGVVPDARNEVREGDLLITRANTPQLVGSTAVVPAVRRKLLLSDKIFRVGLSLLLDAHYAAWIARGTRVRSLSSASSNGASQSMANIRFEEVKEWPIPHIDLPEQKRVVAELDRSRMQTEALRSLITRQLTLLAERRQSLITAAVTGQFNVFSASGRGED